MSQVEQLREALRLSPDNVPLLILFGEACLSGFAPDEAVRAFRRAVELDATQSQAKVGLARALHQSGKTSEAILRLESLVESSPKLADAWLQLSRLFMAEGHRERAVECYEKSLKLAGGRQDVALEQELYIQEAPAKSQRDNEPRKGRVTSEGWEAPGDHPDAFDGEGLEKPDVTFADVGGMEAVKEEIRMKILYPLKNPDLFKAYGKKAGGGVLLYGPPGCGKTLISRAAAGEIEAGFLGIGRV